jgi:hypothetical protein
VIVERMLLPLNEPEIWPCAPSVATQLFSPTEPARASVSSALVPKKSQGPNFHWRP